jgi:predicted NBD/HSP70 family sugar kinase
LANVEEWSSIAKIEATWSSYVDAPVFLLGDGDAAAFSLASQWDHARNPSLEVASALVLTLGTSIGAGFVVNGVPYVGRYTSNVSHIVLEPNGPWCETGEHRGCWKMLVGVEARKDLAARLGLMSGGRALEVRQIAAAARRHERNAEAFFATYGRHVARGLSVILNAMPLDYVIIGGGVAHSGVLLQTAIASALATTSLLPDIAAHVRIVLNCHVSAADGARLYALRRLAAFQPAAGSKR